ncbi:MAG: OmpA family protein [Bacteroidota bacterium]
MRFLALLVFALFLVFALIARWYFVCEVRQLCDEVPQDVRLKTLELKDGETTLLQGYDEFAFDSLSIAPRLNENNERFLDTLAAILEANPDKLMTITAFFRESEKGVKSGYFDNIGAARADQIRKLLMERGIAEARIAVDYGESEDPLLQAPLDFNLYPADLPSGYDRELYTFKNNTFKDDNFAFDSDEFRPGEAFLFYADSLKNYFEAYPDHSLKIVGHTDAVGGSDYNEDLGMRRAKNAMEYFRELGVITEIKINSEGEQNPVASNETDEGRQKNRRVNFIILE